MAQHGKERKGRRDVVQDCEGNEAMGAFHDKLVS
jgi:hypothetical protein